MNTDYTDIVILQDKSTSMRPLQKETIQGFNGFVASQRTLPGKCLLTLVQFSTVFTTVYSAVDVRTVDRLTTTTYNPNGWTALLDAIAHTIIDTGHRFEAMAECDRPARVIFVITTDGDENSSRDYTGPDGRARVMDMIKHQTDVYKWQFIFLGANQDAITTGHSLAIPADKCLSTGVTGQSVMEAYSCISTNTASYRASAPSDTDKLGFTHAQRKAQKDQGAITDPLNS